MRTASDWQRILIECGVRPSTARRWCEVFAEVVGPTSFSQRDRELDDFLGQVLHESNMLETLEENLYYSTPERLMAVWPKRFPTVAAALPCVKNPAKLAAKVYHGRLGNVEHGDAYNYRGRGLIQITGRDNYRAVGNSLGIALETNPDLLLQPREALRLSVAWWERNIPDSVIDNIVSVTKRVNGGTVGLAHRKDLTDRAEGAIT